MKLTFLVCLKICTGGYEKTCLKLIKAESKAIAEREALLGECHNDIGQGAEWEGDNINDSCGEFIYKVSYTKQVKAEHVDILKDYFKPES